MQAEDFKEIPVGADVRFVYRPGLSAVNLSGRFLGIQDGQIKIRVYRTVNYGKVATRDDYGNKVIKDYDPGQDDPNTYNDRTFAPREIEYISVA